VLIYELSIEGSFGCEEMLKILAKVKLTLIMGTITTGFGNVSLHKAFLEAIVDLIFTAAFH
jgi:hypothetical protein